MGGRSRGGEGRACCATSLELKKLDEFDLKEKRYAKFRAFGEVAEAGRLGVAQC